MLLTCNKHRFNEKTLVINSDVSDHFSVQILTYIVRFINRNTIKFYPIKRSTIIIIKNYLLMKNGIMYSAIPMH